MQNIETNRFPDNIVNPKEIQLFTITNKMKNQMTSSKLKKH